MDADVAAFLAQQAHVAGALSDGDPLVAQQALIEQLATLAFWWTLVFYQVNVLDPSPPHVVDDDGDSEWEQLESGLAIVQRKIGDAFACRSVH